MEISGLKPIMYAKKQLNEEETLDFIRKYENCKKNLVVDVEQVELLYNSVEKDLTLIAIFGIQ